MLSLKTNVKLNSFPKSKYRKQGFKSFFTLFILLQFLVITSSKIYSQTLDWAYKLGGQNSEAVIDACVDIDGNIYIICSLMDSIEFDIKSNSGNFVSPNNTRRIYFAKYNSNMDLIWVRSLDESNNPVSSLLSIDTDKDKNVYIGGTFEGTFDIDPSNSTFNLISRGTEDIFILKLDSSANKQLAFSIGGEGRDYIRDLTIDNSGNILITGFFSDSMDFDPSNRTFELKSNGIRDVFISKFSTNGDFQWAKNFGGDGTQSSENEYGYEVVTDYYNNIIVLGFYSELTDFDPGTNSYDLQNIGLTDMFVQKLDSTGGFLWAKGIGGRATTRGNNISIDNSNNILVTGSFVDTSFIYNQTNRDTIYGLGSLDIFLIKLSSNSEFLWGRTFGGNGSRDVGAKINFDINNNIYLFGQHSDSAIFSTPNRVDTLFSKSSFSLNLWDYFIQKLSPNGSTYWIEGFGGSYLETASNLLYYNSSVTLIGAFEGGFDFDPDSNKTYLLNSNSISSFDIFFQKLNDETVGLKSITNLEKIKIYPNPTEGFVNIELNEDIKSYCIEIYSITGSTVFVSCDTNQKVEIDLSKLKNGIYLIQVRDAYQSRTFKLLKH